MSDTPREPIVDQRPPAPRPRAVAMGVLGLARPLAGLTIAAMLVGRAFGPAVVGSSGSGLGRLLWGVEFAGNLLSQLLGMLATVTAVALLLVLLHARPPLYLQIAAVASSGVVLLVGLTALVIRLPVVLGAVIALAAAALALMSALDSARAPFARHGSAVLGAVGIGAMLRLATLLVASLGAGGGRSVLAVTAPRVLATGAFAMEVLAIGLGLAWVASRSRKITTPATFVVLVIAFLITRAVVLAPTDSSSAALLVLRGGVERLIARPEPFLPRLAVVFTAVLAPLTAIAALFARGQVPAISAAVALALLVRSNAEMPLGAISLVVASLTLLLAARDERGFWAAMVADRRAPEDAADPG